MVLPSQSGCSVPSSIFVPSYDQLYHLSKIQKEPLVRWAPYTKPVNFRSILTPSVEPYFALAPEKIYVVPTPPAHLHPGNWTLQSCAFFYLKYLLRASPKSVHDLHNN